MLSEVGYILQCDATEDTEVLVHLNVHPVLLNPTFICSINENKSFLHFDCEWASCSLCRDPASGFTMLLVRQTCTDSCISATAGSWCGPAPAAWPAAAAAPADCCLSRACWRSAPEPPGSLPSAWPALGGCPGCPCPCLNRVRWIKPNCYFHVVMLFWTFPFSS